MSAGSNIFGRIRASSRIGPDYDQEGHLVEVETRDDELQQQRFAEIIDLLVAAGYFRARIKGLSPFDKVVGGMTWCISICNFDVDVDLLFQENSTIGQKISLTEKIVAVLPKMKCSHRIEPHQVQGLDFKSIFPVIQWLVKKVVETRAEMGDHIRAFSISQFDKHQKASLGGDEEQQEIKTKESLNSLGAAYRPSRKYKRQDKSDLKTEESKVSSTLLEYGKRSGLMKSMKTDEELKEGKQEQTGKKKQTGDLQEEISAAFSKVTVKDSSSLEVDEEEEIRIQEEKKLRQLMGGMSEIKGRDVEGKLSARAVGSIIGMQSEEMQNIAAEYAEKRAELARRVKTEKVEVMTPLEKHEKKASMLRTKIEESRQRISEVEEIHTKLAEEARTAKEELSTASDFKERLAEKMHEFDEMESQADTEVLQRIKDLIILNEKLKKQEQDFKEKCRDEAAKLKEDIAKLEKGLESDDVQEDENLEMVEKQLNADNEKLSKIRSVLAAKNRKVAMLTRKIDEIPTRAELTQYQKRFVELYNQIAATQLETKQFYTMYNTLDDKKLYLKKQVDLLDSIYDNFDAARSSPENMTQYMRQFEKIVEGVKSNKMKVEKKREAEKMHRDKLKDQYLELIEQQRLYVKTIHAFQEECRKNEILVEKLQSLGLDV
uniref:coiled-coil domain-containing protein 93-like n=1 Tax=Styela clava TaxID=7725 RepID=UPI001939ED5A|nr:coiled-coil domain-containing protein 93-like [Styela clava]